MAKHTPTPWTIYDDADPHHIMIKGIHPDIGGAHVADVLFPANAAFILKAVNSHEILLAALEKVRSYNSDIAAGRINYRPKDHIQVIDEALAKISP